MNEKKVTASVDFMHELQKKFVNKDAREISIVVNADTRPGIGENKTEAHGGLGCRSWDFLIDSIYAYKRFFQGHSTEVVLLVDIHEKIPEPVMQELHKMLNRGIIDNLALRRSVRFYQGRAIREWKALFYLEALFMAKGKYIAHFDADTSAFRDPDSDFVEKCIEWVESGKYDFVSYPNPNSPDPEPPGSMHVVKADYLWVSTRFFFCKRETLDFTEMLKCITNNETHYVYDNYSKYYDKFFAKFSTEQVLGLIASTHDRHRIFYPPRNQEEYLIFSWHSYFNGTLEKLNRMEWPEIKKYLNYDCGGIAGPCDLHDKGTLQ